MADFKTELIAALKVDEVQNLLVAAVWKEDDEIAAPDTAADRETNPHWEPQSYLKDIGNRVRALTDEVAAVKGRVDSLAVGGVDLDALADKVAALLAPKVADELAARLAD